jgi:hypothetical protein
VNEDQHETPRRDELCCGPVLEPNVTQELADVFRAQECDGPFVSGTGSVGLLVQWCLLRNVWACRFTVMVKAYGVHSCYISVHELRQQDICVTAGNETAYNSGAQRH